MTAFITVHQQTPSSAATRDTSLARPGQGPDRIAAKLRREKWGGIDISANGVWRVLRRQGLNTRAARLALVAGYAATSELPRPEEELEPLTAAMRTSP